MRYLLISLWLASHQLYALTIEEKKSALLGRLSDRAPSSPLSIAQLNDEIAECRLILQDSYERVNEAYEQGEESHVYKELLAEINVTKRRLYKLETRFRDQAVDTAKRDEEGYGLWDLEETSLSNLVMEYGAMDYLYIIPPEMSSLKMSMHSAVPIPRESWSEMLQIILAQNGVGVKEVNPFTRQLFMLKQNLTCVKAIMSKREELNHVREHERIFYLLSPPVEQAKAVFQFFERFADAKQSFVYHIGSKVAIVAAVEEVEHLLDLYDAVWEGHNGKVARVVPVAKIDVVEMEKILNTFFTDGVEKSRLPFSRSQQDKLSVYPLVQGSALALIGSKELVERGEKLIQETEAQLEDPSELAVFHYTCRHSDPAEMAEVLERVYMSLVNISNDTKAGPGKNAEHFIADPKTGSLLMTIRRDMNGKIRDLLKRLDVPKKMVQIEVLLFEKQISSQNNIGLNLLKIGQGSASAAYESLILPSAGSGKGILSFMCKSNGTRYTPKFDLAYSLLMTHDDIQLNAAPSVLTVNQTPAKVEIVEEISINNGAVPIDTNKRTTFENSFTRSQFGITIEVTPTVHMSLDSDSDEDQDEFITLQTNITFETPRDSNNDRPLVDRRHIENEVRVCDGETVIIGGLRRNSTSDREEKVPFLGEIPGIGKLFGSTKLARNNTEMFFFITPKIIQDPKDELAQLRTQELKRRPGDIPEFLERIEEVRAKEKDKFLKSSLDVIIGKGRG